MKICHKKCYHILHERHNMPITYLILHNFDMIIVILTQRNQFNPD